MCKIFPDLRICYLPIHSLDSKFMNSTYAIKIFDKPIS